MLRLRRALIAFFLAYAVAGTYAAETLPLSSPRPAEWYHHPAVVVPALLLMTPFTGGGFTSPWQLHWRVVVVWFAMFAYAVLWFQLFDAVAALASGIVGGRGDLDDEANTGPRRRVLFGGDRE